MTKKFNPKNSTCIITGGSSGIGQAMAIELLNRGAKKIINIDMKSTNAYKHEYYQCSVSNHDMLDETLKDIISKHNVDLYHSNAGQCFPDNHKFSIKYWQHMIDVNFLPHVVAVQNIMPQWLEKNKGHMLITASVAAFGTMPGSGTYTVTKSASLSYAEFLAMTYSMHGIGTTVICPKGVFTGMYNPDNDFNQRIEDMITPFKTAQQVATITLDAMFDKKFMVMTHPESNSAYAEKGKDIEQWVTRLQDIQKNKIEGYNYDKDLILSKKLTNC